MPDGRSCVVAPCDLIADCRGAIRPTPEVKAVYEALRQCPAPRDQRRGSECFRVVEPSASEEHLDRVYTGRTCGWQSFTNRPVHRFLTAITTANKLTRVTFSAPAFARPRMPALGLRGNKDDMPTETILSTLLAGAAFLKTAIQNTATQSVRDAYDAAKAYLRNKFSGNADAVRALELATGKPESLIRKALLAEESASSDLECDAELARLMAALRATLLVMTKPIRLSVTVEGNGNQVQVAGRDLIRTERIVRRNEITPDGRHLTLEQRERLREVVREVAERLAPRNGEANFAAVHRLLQRRFQVASYLLIPSAQYDEALTFLRQHRAMHRSRLRQRDPVAYQNDLYRAIFAGARELGWDGSEVYQFASAKLGHPPIASLKQLGLAELKKLADFIQREVRTLRKNAASSATFAT
jgi:hypothetical protein